MQGNISVPCLKSKFRDEKHDGGGTWVLCVSSLFFSVICLLPGSGWGPESELRSASPEAVQWKHRPWRGKGLVFGEDGVMRGKGVKKLQKKNQDIFRMKVTYKEMSKGNAVAVLMEGCTPRKINMEHNHGGLVQIIFLSFHGWFVGSMLIFQGVSTDVKIYVYIWRKHPSKNTDTSHPLVDSSTSELHDVRTAGTKSALELQGNHMRPPDSVRLDSRVTTCGRGQSMLMA